MKRAGELLSSFIGEHFDRNLMEKARSYSRFFSSWSSILSDNQIAAAADHSRIADFERHMVFVDADHPGWVQILQTKQREILYAIQQRFPDFNIRGIAFRYRALPDPLIQAEKPAEEEIPEDTFPHPPPAEKAPPREESRSSPFERIDDQSFIDTLKRLEQGIIDRENSRGKKRNRG